jgi:hypothetical protein
MQSLCRKRGEAMELAARHCVVGLAHAAVASRAASG